MVKQPVFLRSMSAPSDLEMIANQDVEFTHAPQRYLSCVRERVNGSLITWVLIHFSLFVVILVGGATTLQVIVAARSPCCSL